MSITQLLDTVNYDAVQSSNKYKYQDRYVPRVTTILSSMMHSDALMYWANNLGFKGIRYRDFMNEAAGIGTAAHSRIELFLKEKLDCTDNIPYLGFKTWYDNIINGNNKIEVKGVEEHLTCKWFGGTYDALVTINDIYYLIDFKTSNHVTYKYFLQLAAYMYMLKEKGIELGGVIVLQLNKEEIGFNEYLLDFRIPDHKQFIDNCMNTFFSLVYAYYNVKEVEGMYENIYGKD